jgi:zinc protease
MQTVPVAAEELQKAKNQLLTGFYRSLKTIAGKANLLGQFEVFFAGHEKLNSYPSELEKIAAADVLRVAKAYLGEKNRTVAVLIPEREEAAR